MKPARSLAFGVVFTFSVCLLASARDEPSDRSGQVTRPLLASRCHGGAPDSVYDGTYYDYAGVIRVEPVL